MAFYLFIGLQFWTKETPDRPADASYFPHFSLFIIHIPFLASELDYESHLIF